MGAKKKAPCPTLLCLLVNANLILLRDTTIATLTTKGNLHSLSNVENDQRLYVDRAKMTFLPSCCHIMGTRKLKTIPKLLCYVYFSV